MSNRFHELFANSDRKALIPFFTLGEPNPETSYALICTAVEAGADALELAFPLSDPMASDFESHASISHALRDDTTYDTCLDLLRRIKHQYPALPIGLFLYYQLLSVRGNHAYAELASIGVDAVVCSDAPYEDSAFHMQSLAQPSLGCIQMYWPSQSSVLTTDCCWLWQP